MQAIAQLQYNHCELQGKQIGEFVCSKFLGRGSFAIVYEGFRAENQSQMVALKVIDKYKYLGSRGKQVLKLLDAEADAMTLCNNEHVVKCYKQYKTSRYVIFVLEYCNNKTLHDEIQKRGKIPQDEARRIMKQIVVAFSELHRNNIIHRDLKPENILKHNETYKIGDFGLCKIFESMNDAITKTQVGTLITMAPEVLNKRPYGIKADLWSLGTVYYQMLYGNPPFMGINIDSMRNLVERQPVYLGGISNDSADLFQKLFVTNPKYRISWTELYTHPLFRRSSILMIQKYQQDTSLEEANSVHRLVELKGHIRKDIEQDFKLTMSMIYTEESKTQTEVTITPVPPNIMKQAQNAQQKICSEHTFQLYKDLLNFQMQKSIFIYRQIYMRVYKVELGNLQKQRALFISLILARCLFIMAPLNNALINGINIFDWDQQHYQQFLISRHHQGFLQDFNEHYTEVIKAKTQEDDNFAYIQRSSNDKIQDTSIKQVSELQGLKTSRVFLDGTQGKDYSPEYHGQFVLKYMDKFLMQCLKDTYNKSNKEMKENISRLYYAVKKYKKIALLQYNNGQGKKGLEEAYDRVYKDLS